jgi:diamine N-acetyltransferase
MEAYRPSAGEGGASWRDTTARDVPDILRLVRALAEYERLADRCVATEADFRAALFGERPDATALLAESDGTPVAACIYRRTFSTFSGKPGLWIEDIFVEPAHRGMGLARAAFAEVARRALAQGCTALGWNVLDWNAPAIAAYRAMGAEPQTGWTDMRVSGAALAALAGKA